MSDSSDIPSDSDSFLFRQTSLIVFGLDNVLIGLYTAIVAFIAVLTWNTPSGHRSNRILLRLVYIMYLLRMVHVFTGIWYITITSFVNDADTALDTFNQLFNGGSDTAAEVLGTFSDITLIGGIAIADSIMIWRTYIICDRRWPWVVLQLVLNVIAILTGIVYIVTDEILTISINIPDTLLTINLSLSLATTIICTLLIVYKILSVKKFNNNRLWTAVEIIIESAALYAVSFIVYLPFNQAPAGTRMWYISGYFETIAFSMAGIAPSLIMLRVALDREKPKSTYSTMSSTIKLGSHLSGPPPLSSHHSSTLADDAIEFAEFKTSRVGAEAV